jgi:hypothetical protein
MTKRRTVGAALLIALVLLSGALLLGRSPPTSPESESDPAPPPRGASAKASSNRRPRATSTRDVARGNGPDLTPADGPLLDGRCVFRDGRPAAGARVRAWDVGRLRDAESAEIGAERVADDDGRFIVDVDDAVRQAVVYAALPGFQTAGAVLKVEGARTAATLTFGEGGVLTGRVVGPWGKPAGRVEVRLRPVDRKAHMRGSNDWRLWSEPGIWEWYAPTTLTDGGGLYRFEGVPLPRDGVPQARVPVVEVAGRFWRGEEVAFETDGQEIERDVVIGGSEWSPSTAAIAGAPNIRGVVVDESGNPLELTSVECVALGEPEDHFGTLTDKNGRFDLEPGPRFQTRGRRLEIRVRSLLGMSWRGPPPPPGEALTVRLSGFGTQTPGSICGTAFGSDMQPLTGPLPVDLVDVEEEPAMGRRRCARRTRSRRTVAGTLATVDRWRRPGRGRDPRRRGADRVNDGDAPELLVRVDMDRRGPEAARRRAGEAHGRDGRREGSRASRRRPSRGSAEVGRSDATARGDRRDPAISGRDRGRSDRRSSDVRRRDLANAIA